MMRFEFLFVLFAGYFWILPVVAQVPDPTRPPDAMSMPNGTGGVLVPSESGVQAVILRRKGKSSAVINGQFVEVGGKLGDKKVLKISESEVVLMGSNGREVLKVTPDIQKLPTVKPAVSIKRATGTTQR